MAHINDINSIIVAAANANFTAHTYTQVYAGADAAPTINGVAVTMAGSSILSIKVKSISATSGVYLLGEKQNVVLGSTSVG
jgi:hypothetical protein